MTNDPYSIRTCHSKLAHDVNNTGILMFLRYTVIMEFNLCIENSITTYSISNYFVSIPLHFRDVSVVYCLSTYKQTFIRKSLQLRSSHKFLQFQQTREQY